MNDGKRWMVQDNYGNAIYLTQERWDHIIDPINHPEMVDYESYLKKTIQTGKRKQDSLSPYKYRYAKDFNSLSSDNTHIVAIVLFRYKETKTGMLIDNNYIVTAYQKQIARKARP